MIENFISSNENILIVIVDIYFIDLVMDKMNLILFVFIDLVIILFYLGVFM